MHQLEIQAQCEQDEDVVQSILDARLNKNNSMTHFLHDTV